MIGVLLTILKVIGIIILALIALALLIVLMVLFIPVRYRGKIYFKKTPDIDLSVTWFFKFLNISLKFKDELDISAKVAWVFTVFSNKEDSKNEQKVKSDNKDAFEKETEEKSLLKKENSEEKSASLKGDNIKKHKKDTENIPPVKADELNKQEKKHSKAVKKAKDKKKDKKNKSLPEKILEKVKDIHYIITNDENKLVFMKMLEKVKKIIVHVLPRKISGYFKFGFEDPSVTGQVLEILAVFYPLYKDDFKIIPMFYDEIIEVDISFKGRLRIFYAAYIGLLLWLNKKKIKTRHK